MFFRYFVALCVVAFCAVTINAEIEEDVQVHDIDIDTEERANPLVNNALKILGKQFTGVAAHCLKEAADNCKKQLFPPKRLIQCARDYFKENQASCVVDKIIN